LLKAASAAKSAALTAAEFGLAAAKWALATGATAASVAVGALGTALTALGIGPLLLLIGALIGGLAMLADHFGLINLDPIVAGFESLIGTLGSLVPSIDQITSLLGTLTGVGGKPKGMMEWAQMLLGVLLPIIPITRAVLKHFGLLDDVGAMLESAVAGAMGFVNSLLGGIKRLISNPRETLAAFADAGIDFVKTMARKVMMAGPKFLRNAISSALSSVLPFLPSSDAKRGPLSNLTGAGAALVKTIAKGILGAPGAIATAIGSALSGALGGIGNVALSIGSEIAHGIADGISGAAGAIGGAVKGAMDAAKGVADAAGGALSGAASAVGGTVSGAANAANTVGNAVGAAGQAAGNVIGGVGDTVGGLLGGGGGGAGKTQNNNTQIHFHGEVHDAQKVDKKVRKAQRQAVQQAQGGIEDALSMGKDAADSLI
ncbi:hypothetical protein FXF75_18155, partial [Halorussus sp. MSC15.2]|nr:hypothetical protein [Halorussus sp. MSC15.2]